MVFHSDKFDRTKVKRKKYLRKIKDLTAKLERPEVKADPVKTASTSERLARTQAKLTSLESDA